MTQANGLSLNWDSNGNMVTFGSTYQNWNWDNRLRSAGSGGTNVSYRYDHAGAMVSRIENNIETLFILDYTEKVPSVLMEIALPNQNIEKSYTWINGQVIRQTDNAGDSYFYVHDRHGSVRLLIDTDGDIVNSYTYDPFGNVLESTINVENPWLYGNYYYDSTTGMYYCYQRWYHPLIARFAGYDPILGDMQEPLTLHAYLYCMNNAINDLDPSGEFSLGGLMSSQGIRKGMKAYGAYDNAMRVKNIFEQFINGVNHWQIAKGLMIEIAADYAGGKALDAIIGGARALRRIGKAVTANWSVAKARRAGKLGESLSNIPPKGKRGIPSYTGTSKSGYRFPDQIDDAGNLVIEVKNRKKVDFTEQIQDYLYYCMAEKSQGINRNFVLRVRKSTQLSGPMQRLVDEGFVILQDLKGNPLP